MNPSMYTIVRLDKKTSTANRVQGDLGIIMAAEYIFSIRYPVTTKNQEGQQECRALHRCKNKIGQVRTVCWCKLSQAERNSLARCEGF